MEDIIWAYMSVLNVTMDTWFLFCFFLLRRIHTVFLCFTTCDIRTEHCHSMSLLVCHWPVYILFGVQVLPQWLPPLVHYECVGDNGRKTGSLVELKETKRSPRNGFIQYAWVLTLLYYHSTTVVLPLYIFEVIM